MAQLIIRILPLLVSGAIDPLDHEVFQTLFGMMMTLLIAMEFKHSISLAWSTGCCVSAMIASLAARIEPFVLCLLVASDRAARRLPDTLIGTQRLQHAR